MEDFSGDSYTNLTDDNYNILNPTATAIQDSNNFLKSQGYVQGADGNWTQTDSQGNVNIMQVNNDGTLNDLGSQAGTAANQNGGTGANAGTSTDPSGIQKLLTSFGYDPKTGSLSSFLSNNSGAITGLAALAALTGGNTPTTSGYQGTVPNLNAYRSQVQGAPATNGIAMGQSYFTPMQYAAQGDAAANAAAAQANKANQIVLNAQNQANQPSAPTTAQPAMATPWIAAQQAQQQRINNQMNAPYEAPASGVRNIYPTPLEATPPPLDLQRQLYAQRDNQNQPPSIGSIGQPPIPQQPPTDQPPVEMPIDQAPVQGPVATPLNPVEMMPLAVQAARGGLMSFDDGGQVPDGTVVWSPMQITKSSQARSGYATGGITDGMRQPTYLQGTTDGMADKIPTTIDGKEPALLSHGEFVIPADVVSHLGNGNSDAGAEQLYKMMDRIREARTGNKEQGKRINPDKFTPGGIAGYAGGGEIKHYDGTSTSAVTSSSTTSPATALGTGASSSNTLSPYVGQYVTNMLGQGQALANQPMPVYRGELTAGPSDLQQQQFSGLSQLAQTGLTPTNFQVGTFDANAAAQYMNPYLQASLDPQLAALQRQSAINEQGDLSKLTQAGAYGGSRQAVLQGQDQYNLLSQQANLIGQGYNTAYNNAMNQFNTANSQSLQAQQNQEAANEAAANYGLSTLNALGQAGATQQQLNQAADTAQLSQFNQQMNYPYAQLQFEQGLLNGLPVSTTSTTQNQTALGNILNTVGGLGTLSTQLKGLTGSSGTTGTTSSGTTTS